MLKLETPTEDDIESAGRGERQLWRCQVEGDDGEVVSSMRLVEALDAPGKPA